MLPFNKIQTHLILFLVLILAQSSCISHNKNDSLMIPSPRWIAHALGGWNGATYLNCAECFESNYTSGFRYFEMDFLKTSDGAMVGIHDGQEEEFGLPSPFTLEQFKNSSIKGTTPVDETELARWMVEKSDWFLITDVKSDNLIGLRRLCEVLKNKKIDCRDRIIPQFYSPEEFAVLKEIAFNRSIFTLYRFGNDLPSVKKILSDNPAIWALTVPAAWWSPEYTNAISELGRVGFVHTINDKSEADRLLLSGVSGIYTDFLFY
ncbi:MAG: hypothetical protein EOP04_14065 [Proteobacteria bacterium]|nr:MAG: hypothetical protein EOP04_14065 [Pseudomonadota bacterium]